MDAGSKATGHRRRSNIVQKSNHIRTRHNHPSCLASSCFRSRASARRCCINTSGIRRPTSTTCRILRDAACDVRLLPALLAGGRVNEVSSDQDRLQYRDAGHTITPVDHADTRKQNQQYTTASKEGSAAGSP